LNGRERVGNVMGGRMTDRVPVWEALIDPPMVTHVLGIIGRNSAQLEPADLVRLHVSLGLDGIVCGLKFFRPTASMSGRHVPMSSVPRPSKAEGEHYLHRVREVARLAHEEGLAVAAYTHGAFDVVYESLGFENFMLLLYDEPEYVEEVTAALFAYHLQSALDALATGIDWFVVGDDLAFKTGIFLSPDMLLGLWKEREATLVRTIRDAGLPVEFHCDGKIDFILPHLIEMGVGLVNPVEPYSNDIRAIKREYGGRIAFRGNLDIAGTLAFGTPEESYEEAAELVRDMAPGGGYVFSTSHSIASGVRPENYMAALRAARDHGTY
jgi:uroporphyrinogen decarboxylase